jgi:hypothetical protein
MLRTARDAIVATGVLVMAMVAASGSANARGLEDKWRSACWRDAFSICTLHAIANDRPGVRDCLVRNIDRISKACQAVIKEADDQGIHDAKPHDDPVSSAQAAAPTPR